MVAASGPDNTALTRMSVLGVVSLILWALFIIVTLKYVVILLRADNNGEGGTLTLMALASRALGRFNTAVGLVALLGIISAALFYGDAVITPALSVLSAIEGLDVATPAFHSYVVPFTVVILVILFAGQSFGTARVAALFGPVMVVWFVAIALPGLAWIARDPGIMWALNPFYGVNFLVHHGMVGLYTLGAVFLAVVPSRWHGSSSCCRRWRSIISGRAHSSSRSRRRSRIRSFCFIPTGRLFRWCCWRRLRPSSPARP
jgi:KUP system potassium uptake protein